MSDVQTQPRSNASNVKQVAELVGVSPITVSRAFSGNGAVAPKTRERIMAVARELGYQPNPLAQALRNTRTRTLAIMGHGDSGYTNLHATEVLATLDRRAREHGYRALISFSWNDTDQFEANLKDMLAYRVDGLILHHPVQREHESLFARWLPATLPVVSLLPAPNSPWDMIHVDFAAGTYQLAEQAVAMGHRQFAFCCSKVATNRSKYQGLVDALKIAGLPGSAVGSIVEGADEPRDAEKLVRQLMACHPRPTCVVCSSDYVAVVVINQLQKMGVRIPEDISVTGFDDLWIRHLSNVSIATARQPREQMGQQAMQMLLDRIENPKLPRRVRRLIPTLVVGESLGPLPEGIFDRVSQ